ncbi:MAG: hypothetical protein JO362_23445 [Streptomycetaceae bacterium]|nr:hypothetical protein [Streptomycetaceae bacterium]
METPEHLTGGHLNATVCRIGDRVRRPAGPWSPAVHALLAHLRQAGLTLAPAPYGIQDSAQGPVEELSFLPGQVPTGGAEPDWLFTDDTVIGVARSLRHLRTCWSEALA